HVSVLDDQLRPLMPCRPARARLLLQLGKAAMLKRHTFTIVLQEAKPNAVVERVRVKLEPGSRAADIALLNDSMGEILWAAEGAQRSHAVPDALVPRRASRC